MPNSLFEGAVRLIGEAKRRPPNVSVRLIFDLYRTSSQEMRDAIVLALIGEVVTTEVRRLCSVAQVSEAA